VVAELLRDKPNGRYRIKGACSCCGLCGATIDVQAGASASVEAEVTRFVRKNHQPGIGIQPFVSSFPASELRFWTVADDHTLHRSSSGVANMQPPRFRSTNILLKTSASRHSVCFAMWQLRRSSALPPSIV
jgi:hypothetical protein